MTDKEAKIIHRDYAASQGAVVKVVGDIAYQSPGYDQRQNRGRLIRLKGVKNNRVIVWDNKKGILII